MMQAYQTNDSREDVGAMRKFRRAEDYERTGEILEASEQAFLKYLIDMHGVLTKEQIDLEKFKDIVSAIEALKKTQEHEYYTTLVRPEKTRGAKIPSQIPIPSSSFQLKQSFYITTNALGNASIIVNPFYLGAAAQSTVYVNNNASLNGISSSDFFTAVNAGQNIPSVYNQYRLVSASLIAKYVGRLDIVQGLIGGAIIFDQSIVPGAVGSVNTNLAKYGDFNLAQDAFFQQENYTLQGMRELYFPLDTTYEQYQPVGTSKNGFGMLLYILGAPPSSNVFKIDLFFNMECLPDVTFLNYIPTSLSTATTAGKDEAIKAAQQHPITTVEEAGHGVKNNSGSIFDKVVSTMGKFLPSIDQIIPFVKEYGGKLIKYA